MAMPIRVFWAFNNNISRIEARQRINSLEVATHSQGGEGAVELFRQLQFVVGEVVSSDVEVAPLDKEGLNSLREMQ